MPYNSKVSNYFKSNYFSLLTSSPPASQSKNKNGKPIEEEEEEAEATVNLNYVIPELCILDSSSNNNNNNDKENDAKNKISNAVKNQANNEKKLFKSDLISSIDPKAEYCLIDPRKTRATKTSNDMIKQRRLDYARQP
jgi:hypothetical protein